MAELGTSASVAANSRQSRSGRSGISVPVRTSVTSVRPARSWAARRPSPRSRPAARTTHVASTRSGVPSCHWPKRRPPSGPAAGRAAGGPGRRRPRRRPSSATIGFVSWSLAPRAETCVGSQPVLAMPASTRHVPAPRSTAAVWTISRHGDAIAWATANAGVRRHLVAEQVERRVGPDAEVVPAAELDGPELRVVERVPRRRTGRGRARRHQRSTASAWASVGPRYQKSPPCFSPVAAVDDVPELRRPRRTRRGARRPSRRRHRSSSSDLSHVKSSKTECTV